MVEDSGLGRVFSPYFFTYFKKKIKIFLNIFYEFD